MAHVGEVGRRPQLTRVPGLPPYLAGVANWRGRVLAVLDLRTLFGAAAPAPGPAARPGGVAADSVRAPGSGSLRAAAAGGPGVGSEGRWPGGGAPPAAARAGGPTPAEGHPDTGRVASPGSDRLLVLSVEGLTVGVLTDAVHGVIDVDPASAAPVPVTVPRRTADLLSGQVLDADGPIGVLDVGALLRLRETWPLTG